MSKLEMKQIGKTYANGVQAVQDFSLDVTEGEFVVLVGPSGCGKSTVLRMIAGLESISEGQMVLDQTRINEMPPRERNIAMVFQNYALYPHMTVYDNMAFCLKQEKKSKEEIDQIVHRTAARLDIEDLLKRKPKTLSGGERQRVAMGRAIVRQPKLFLMDEPLSNLDAKLRSKMRREIARLHKELEATIIYVTHDQVEAMTLGTKIVVMKDGRIQQIDTPENLYYRPANTFVAQFIGTPQMNLMEMRVVANENMDIILQNEPFQIPVSKRIQRILQDAGYAGKDVIVGARAEDIVADEIGNDEPIDKTINVCRISDMEFQGNDSYLFLELENQEELVVKVNENNWRKRSDALEKVQVSFSPEAIHIFDQDSGKRIDEKSVLRKMYEGGAL